MTDKYSNLLQQLSHYLTATAPLRWADLGCGNGVFTEALAKYLPVDSTITAVDNIDQRLAAIMGNRVSISFQQADFVKDQLQVPPLDGIIMANALHFVKDKKTLIKKLEKHFVGKKRFVFVEYDHSTPNQWEPYPINYTSLKALFYTMGYSTIEKIGTLPSQYGGHMYASWIVNDA